MRSFFNSPLEGAFEITEFMMAGVVFLGLAYMQREKGHLAIEIFTERMPPWARHGVRVFGYLVALLLFSAIAYETSQLAYRAWEIDDYTMGATRLPLWPVKSAIAFGSILFCIRLVVDMVCDLAALAKRREEGEGASWIRN
jgi:TRAP-type C4-dicarboxylate transport system permease small subunit